MQINTKANTVFILVGPTMCGKSTFSQKFKTALNTALEKHNMLADTVLLSSDEERRTLLNMQDTHRHSPPMIEASELAFKVLMAKFEAAISFPINAPFVILDTTGMSDIFRKQVKEIASRHEYRTELVTFEYSKYWDSFTKEEQRVCESAVRRFKQTVLPNLGRKDHDNVVRIKTHEGDRWKDLSVVVDGFEHTASCYRNLPHDKELVVIGDIHEHTKAFEDILAEVTLHSTPDYMVLIGDYLDKGGDTAGILNGVEEFQKQGGLVIIGNHESYAAKRLRGELKNPDLNIENKYMTSVPTLLGNEDLAAQFLRIFDASYPFLVFNGKDVRTLYLTHAPCENKYLGKVSNDALKAQRNLRVKDREADYREAYNFIFKQGTGNHPLHVFGHVAHASDKLEFRNKIFLDTGAVYGNSLTAFIYKGNRYSFKSVKTTALVEETLATDRTTPIKPPEAKFNIHDYNLSPEDLRFLKRALSNNIKYISGTMAPAPSTNTEIESLKAGLDYFRESGVSSVQLQPKYMGSRCQAYLYRGEPDRCFLVSRNGFKIRITEPLKEMIAELLSEFEAKAFEWNSLILDGELLPWTTLGLGLVEEQFKAYEGLVYYELSTLAQDEEYQKLEFKQKIDASYLLEVDLPAFSNTLNMYSDVGIPYYRAFSILKMDEVVTKDLAQSFELVNSQDAITVNFSDEYYLTKAKEFFNEVTMEGGMEGVVIKPMENLSGVAPYMKVRSEEYLTLVYGYDYKHRYEQLCRQKRVGGKLKVSITEHNLATRMLSAENGPEMTELIVKMISHLNEEKEMDPRL